MQQRTRVSWLCVMCVVALAASALAGTVVYDPFPVGEEPGTPGYYNVGETLGLADNEPNFNSSVGNVDEEGNPVAWGGQGNWFDDVQNGASWAVNASTLSFARDGYELATSGGSLRSQWAIGSPWRRFRSEEAPIDEGTVYFSFLAKWNAWNGGWQFYGFGSEYWEADSGAKLFVRGGDGTVSAIFTDNGFRSPTHQLTAGKTYLFVGRVDINQKFTVWINPKLHVGEPSDPADYEAKLECLVPEGYEDGFLDAVIWSPRITTGSPDHEVAFDEWRIGTTWADVTPHAALSGPPSATDVAIAGNAIIGETLTGSYTYVGANPEGATTFRWLIADSADGVYAPIGGATGASYTLTQDDAGKFVKFEVTPVDDQSQQGEAVLSAPSGAIVEPPQIYVYDPFVGTDPQEPGTYLLGTPLNAPEPANTSNVNSNVGTTGTWSGEGNWAGRFQHANHWIPQEEGLSYVSGDLELATGGGGLVNAYPTVGQTSLTRRPFLSSAARLTEGSVYFSMLLKWNAWNGGWQYYGFGTTTGNEQNGAKLFVNAGTGVAVTRFVPGSVDSAPYNLTVGETYLIVGRVDINETFTVWINPALGIPEDELTEDDYDAKLVSTAPAGYNVQGIWEVLMAPRIRTADAEHVVEMDEVRVGKTFASVTPAAAIGPDAPSAENVAIEGEPRVGETLTGTYDFIGGSDLSEYRWLRWVTDGFLGDWVAIDGATSIQYTVTAADALTVIKFEVTPIDEGGPGEAAESDPFGPIYVLGDFNGDGVLSGLDIPGFKQALADPNGWSAANPSRPHPDDLGDFNGDGVFSGLDIPGFKQALAGN